MRAHLPVLAILFMISPSAWSTSQINVPLDHWSYQFIERLQAKGVLGKYLSNSQPYSRGEMAEMIARTSHLRENGSIHLTDVEIELLEEMKREFAQELPELGYRGIRERGHLLDWTSGERTLVVGIGFAQDSSFNTDNPDREATYRSTLAVLLYGDMLKNVSFYNQSRGSYEAGNEPSVWEGNDPRYLPFREGWSGLSDAYIVFGSSRISIQAGKDAVLWGPGYHGVIGLAGVDPTFDMVRFRTKMWKVNFTSLLGFLRDDLTKKHLSDVPRKYLSGHRVEIIPYPGICIAWQEVFIYAEKLHLQLLNPIMPYQMAEDYLGEIGNNTMEGDFELTLIPNTKLYAALFLDDFHPHKSPFKYPGFGWAILGGAMIADPFGIDNTDTVLEYARVEPWAYTHRGTSQDPPIPTAYRHFQEPLGHWIGPNADDLFAQIGWQVNKNIYGSISYNRIRHGEIGGNMYEVADYEKEQKRFLEGTVESKSIIGLGLGYTTFHKFEISASYKYIGTKNRQDEDKQDREYGWNTEENEFSVVVELRY